MLRRLPGLAARMHLSPAQVWALDVEEWIVMASALDAITEAEAAEIARAKASR